MQGPGVAWPVGEQLDRARRGLRLGNAPGSFLSMGGFVAAPLSFGWSRWLDWLGSLPDAAARRTHLRVVRWTLDELPLARRLFEEVVELLYREDRFLRGTLLVRGRPAAPERVEAPLLSVINPRSRLVPPRAVLPFHGAVRSGDRRVLWYRGDSGVALQHVGVLVGRRADRELWPEIVRWVHAH
jgi:polyhydroxyalkanoate synthase